MTKRIRRTWSRSFRRWMNSPAPVVMARAALLGLAFLVGLAAA